MTAKYQPYPKYKPSGVEWLGDIPELWTVYRTRFLCNMTTGERDTQDAEDGGEYPFFVRSDTIERISTWSFNGEGVLTSGDGAGVGKIFHHYKGKMEIHQRVYLFYNFQHLLGRYFYHFLKENLFKVALEGGAKSTVDSLRRPMLLDFPIAVPPLDMQQEIVELIDRETSKIDTLVSKQQELIERLKEKRRALVSRCVTRGLPPEAAQAAGLDPHPKLKPSGVEWIGDIPKHWTVNKFGYISRVVRGGSPRPAGDSRFFNGDFMPWITVAEVTKDGEKFLTETKTMLTPEGAERSRTISEGTLVLTNSGATLGVPKILKITGCANDGIVAFLDLSKKANKTFLYYYLSSLTENLRDRIKQGSGQPNLNTEIVQGLSVPLPSENEQQRIADFLAIAVVELENVASTVQEAIDRLQEYRTALITAAVTGKIDVREVTP